MELGKLTGGIMRRHEAHLNRVFGNVVAIYSPRSDDWTGVSETCLDYKENYGRGNGG